jgi:hypothetical protein
MIRAEVKKASQGDFSSSMTTSIGFGCGVVSCYSMMAMKALSRKRSIADAIIPSADAER